MLRFIACISISFALWYLSFVTLTINITTVTSIYLLTGGWAWLVILSKTLKRDLTIIFIGIKGAIKASKLVKNKVLVSDLIIESASKHSKKIALISADDGKQWTYSEMEKFIKKIANMFYAAGYKHGDVVVLVMENRIEYTPLWIGLSMIGVVTALVNYNLRNESLKHCIEISRGKAIIFSEEMSGAVEEIRYELTQELYCFDSYKGGMEGVKCISEMLGSVPALQPLRPTNINLTEATLYMYTSGTTGLPKASIMKATRLIGVCAVAKDFFSLRTEDVVYDCLPLYHANSSVVSLYALANGCTLVIKKKFSASRFMEECCKFNVTFFNYIGEICRYLLAQPASKYDRENQIRVATGNGLKGSIWKEFQERFGIEKVLEFYGATESTVGLANLTGQVGAVGYNLIAFPFFNVLHLVRVDKETGEIVRDRNGLAILAKPGEPGHLVGKLFKNDPARKFDGYLDKAATQKKIGNDIFKKGDQWFLSGDILVMDELGYFYFQDRTGDTFRWRGENVSTNEVEGIISKSVQLADVTVFGVEIPDVDGKAGMACFNDPERKINVDDLQQSLEKDLPRYAHPVFLRMASHIDVTGTYKFQKKKLREEGFNVDACSSDDFYYFDTKSRRYAVLTNEIREKILSGKIRL